MKFYSSIKLTQSNLFRLYFIEKDIIRGRGGVEDTTFEAKAKDTKKSKAKDQVLEDRPFRGQGQECSRPKIKDTRCQCSPKKWSKKNFLAISKKRSSREKTPILRAKSGVLKKNEVFANFP